MNYIVGIAVRARAVYLMKFRNAGLGFLLITFGEPIKSADGMK